MPAAKAIVIGSGVGGLAVAIRLAIKGYRVTVIEKNNFAGGKISLIQNNGYSFDAGPSLLTQPELIEELFELAGESSEEYFTYQPVTESCRYFFENGIVVHAYSDRDLFAKEMELKVNEDLRRVKKYLQEAAILYNKIGQIFLNHSLQRARTWFNKEIFSALWQTRYSYLFQSLNEFNRKRFRSPETVRIFNRFATYNGSDPFQAPAMLSMIPHIEFNTGVFFPRGGMRSIADALHRLAVKKGVEFLFGTPVEGIIHERNYIRGVRFGNTEMNCDLLVSNADIYFTYRDLLGDIRAADRVLKTERSSSAFVFCWGVKQEFPQLHLHNIFFSKDSQEEFTHIFKSRKVYDDPTIYINITSKMERGHAPDGKENWFVMINAPVMNEVDMELIKQKVRKEVVTKINRLMGIDLESLIESEEIVGPAEIEKGTSSYAGSLYGSSSNSVWSAFMRHANFSKKYRGLYFAGGTVHPGGGIPLCLKSAKIVSDLVR